MILGDDVNQKSQDKEKGCRPANALDSLKDFVVGGFHVISPVISWVSSNVFSIKQWRRHHAKSGILQWMLHAAMAENLKHRRPA